MTYWRVTSASHVILIVLCAFLALESVTGGACENYTGACVATSSRRLTQTDEERDLQDAGVTDFPYAYGLTVTPSEAFSSQRARVFPFGCGPAVPNGAVEAKTSAKTFPGAYNVVTRNRGELFVLGGVASQFPTQEPPFIAKVDSDTMEELWRIQLDDNPVAWEISGALALASDGSLIAVYGRHVVRLLDNGEQDKESVPENVRVFNKTMGDGSTVWYRIGELPLAEGTYENSTAYAGFILMPGGTIITRSLHRKRDCTLRGLYAVMNSTVFINNKECGGPGANSTLVVLNGTTLGVLQEEPFAGVIPGRMTSGEHRGRQYVYVADMEGDMYRFLYANNSLSIDSWRASAYAPAGGAITGGCTAVVPLGGWLIVGDSAIPSPTKYTLTAVWQDDPSIVHYLEPFKDFKDRVPDPSQNAEISWAPTSVAVDPTTNLLYMADFMAGGLAAYRLTAGGFVRQWVLRQWSPTFLALVGPAGQRVLVSSNATQVTTPPTVGDAFAQSYQKSVLIYRNATSGEEITRSPELGISIVLPHVPGFDGEYFQINMLPDYTLTKLNYDPGQCESRPGGF